MKVIGSIGVVALGFMLVSTLAQAQSADPPTPGPEHEALGVWVGNWTIEGETLDSPFGPGGRFSGTWNCEWFEGRFAVVCDSLMTGPDRQVKELEIMTFDTYAKAYQL